MCCGWLCVVLSVMCDSNALVVCCVSVVCLVLVCGLFVVVCVLSVFRER